MNKTRIEWCRSADGAPGWASNPVKGYCPMACPYCYARAMYDRFHWDKTIRFKPEELAEWAKAKAGEKVFVGSTIELFRPFDSGGWIFDHWMRAILDHVARYPDVTFIFLTKCPENLSKWNPWPANCWVGTTIDDGNFYGMPELFGDIDARVKFASLEPLLKEPDHLFDMKAFDWLIIGAQTNPYKPPKWEWIEKVIEKANWWRIPVFLKDNLFKAYPDLPKRQEFPNE